jgi:hypothetical protein
MENNHTSATNHKRLHFDLLFPFLLHPRATAPKVSQKRATWLTPLLLVSLLMILRVAVATPASASTPIEVTPSMEQGPKGMEDGTQFVSAKLGGGGGGGGGGEGTPVPEGGMPAETTDFSIGSLILPALGAVASLWAGWLLLSVLLYVGMVISGSNNTFTETLNLVGWSSLPLGLRQIPLMIAALAFPTVATNPGGLAALASSLSGPAGMFLTPLLKLVDLYLIWQVILLLLGLKQISPLSTRRVVTITLGAVLLFLALAAMPGFFSAIFAQLTQPVPQTYGYLNS